MRPRMGGGNKCHELEKRGSPWLDVRNMPAYLLYIYAVPSTVFPAAGESGMPGGFVFEQTEKRVRVFRPELATSGPGAPFVPSALLTTSSRGNIRTLGTYKGCGLARDRVVSTILIT